MVKTVEKVELPEDDYKVYRGTCKKLGRSLRKQTTLLIQNFIKSRHSELDDPMVAQSYFRDKVVLILNEYGKIYHEERMKKLNLANIQAEYDDERRIKLLKNNHDRTDSDIEKVREFYRFLTGEEMPEKISIGRGHAPKMSENKAFSIIWFLQEHLSIFPNTIERCSVCGELYDINSEGVYWEAKGKHYCGGCCDIVPYNYDRGLR